MLNPELRRHVTPPVKKYTLRIPRNSTELFLTTLATVSDRDKSTIKRYRVRRGDTISSIARNWSVPSHVLLSYNKLSRRSIIRPGQNLLIPISYKGR